MDKIKVGIIGTGNIGTDLLMKIMRSPILECEIFSGQRMDSPNIIWAQQIGVPVTGESVSYFESHPSSCSIVFDATSAAAHKKNAAILARLGKFVIDLTPAHVGEFCIPVINLKKVIRGSKNVNMITCGGQAVVPLAYAICKVQSGVKYIELVATIASKSAGVGTRNNIDEFTQTTKDALTYFTGIENTKAIITLNPADPPIVMHNTMYMLVDNPDMSKIRCAVQDMEKKLQRYIPGYRIVTGPIYRNGQITLTMQVVGSGDFLPKYAGNLDIITCAAVEVASEYAGRLLKYEE